MQRALARHSLILTLFVLIIIDEQRRHIIAVQSLKSLDSGTQNRRKKCDFDEMINGQINATHDLKL